MSDYAFLAHRLLGRWSARGKEIPKLQRELFKAHVELRADAYLAGIWLAAILAAVCGLLVGTVVALALQTAPPPLRALLPLLSALMLGGWAYALAPLLLKNQANELGKEIDENLPHALNHLLSLASAGLTPRDMWGGLAKATAFGPLAYEAGRIRRDLDLFGHDLLTAMKHAQERTASKRFEEFLQGAISAFQSGVDLENYLRTKGAQSQRQAVEEQLKTFDTMGIMAEAFLVTVVAGPLFLIILLTVMSVNQGRGILLWGYLLVLVFIPLSQIMVGTIIKGMNPKVWT